MRRTILVADDSSTIQRLITQTFADDDFEIVSVSNGDAAIRKFEALRPDVVLADIYMPGKDGYEVCAYIKRHALLSSTPVVLLVGAFDAFDETSARQVGAEANITKPFEPHALVNLVSSLLPAERQLPPMVEKVALADASAESSMAALMPDADVEIDLLGLEQLFQSEARQGGDSSAAVSEQDIERIADRVIQKLSTQVIESIAWDVVPDITEKVLREELRKTHES